MVDIINHERYFKNPLKRHFYINEELIHNPKVVGIKTGRDEKEGYFVKYQEKMAWR